MEERFADDAYRVLELAREEAAALKHDWFGTEHLLLGLARALEEEDAGAGVEALRRVLPPFVGSRDIRERVLEWASPRTGARASDEPSFARLRSIGTSGERRVTPRVKRVAERAARLATDDEGADLAGTQHLILALFREAPGPGHQILVGLGVSYRSLANKLAEFGALPDTTDPEEALDEPYAAPRFGGIVMAVSRDELEIIRQRSSFKGLFYNLLPDGNCRVEAAAEAATGYPGLKEHERRSRMTPTEMLDTYELFADDASRILKLGEEEARALEHHWFGIPHLLLGLARAIEEGAAGPGVEAVRRVLPPEVGYAGLREAALSRFRPWVKTEAEAKAEEAKKGDGEPRFNPRMEKVMQRATRLAADDGEELAGTHHLILAVFWEAGWFEHQRLTGLGLTYRALVEQLVELGVLSGPVDTVKTPKPPARPPRLGKAVVVSREELKLLLRRLPSLLPPGRKREFAFNHLPDGRSYAKIGEGLDAEDYVRRALTDPRYDRVGTILAKPPPGSLPEEEP